MHGCCLRAHTPLTACCAVPLAAVQVLGLPSSTAHCDAIAAVAAAADGSSASTHVFLGMSDGHVLHAQLHAQPSTL